MRKEPRRLFRWRPARRPENAQDAVKNTVGRDLWQTRVDGDQHNNIHIIHVGDEQGIEQAQRLWDARHYPAPPNEHLPGQPPGALPRSGLAPHPTPIHTGTETGETSATSGGPSRRTILLGASATLATAAGALVALRLTDDSSDAREYSLVGHLGDVNSVAFSCDGIVASGSTDKTVRLWNIADREQKPVPPMKGHRGNIHAVAFSRDGKTLASGSYEKEIFFWGADGAKLGHAEGLSWVMSVAFNYDGKILASGHYDHRVRLWDVAKRTLIKTLEGHTEAVNSVAFDYEGRFLASASKDNTILLWDPTNWDKTPVKLTGGPRAKENEKHDGLNGVAFSPDKKYLAAAGSNHNVLLWEVANLEKDDPISTSLSGHSSQVLSVAFSADSKTLASCGRDNTIRFWDVKTEEHIGAHGIGEWVKSVAFNPGGEELVSGGDDDKIWVRKPPWPAD
ncbi:WD40 repeat domain-containing protein [Streptomyces halstedii]|uniref:WD40 repeat domain-containing protein n=1 Tax=Streptomyces halstedii TaxID=1944 RepID=UPI00382E0FA0